MPWWNSLNEANQVGIPSLMEGQMRQVHRDSAEGLQMEEQALPRPGRRLQEHLSSNSISSWSPLGSWIRVGGFSLFTSAVFEIPTAKHFFCNF